MEYFIDKFVEYGGVFGLLAIGEFIVIGFLFRQYLTIVKENKDLINKRVEDWQMFKKDSETQLEANRQAAYVTAKAAELANSLASQTLEAIKSLTNLVTYRGKQV